MGWRTAVQAKAHRRRRTPPLAWPVPPAPVSLPKEPALAPPHLRQQHAARSTRSERDAALRTPTAGTGCGAGSAGGVGRGTVQGVVLVRPGAILVCAAALWQWAQAERRLGPSPSYQNSSKS